MKRLCIIMFSFFPLLGWSETVENFQIGTPHQPTIDGHFLADSQKPAKTVVKEDVASSKSRLLPVPEVQKKSSSTWSQSHIASVLEKAAEGGKLAYVLNAAKRYQLPASVALIPIIESRYQTHAVSPKGAVGLWQLSRAVASDFDLPEQARTDWRASTEVALQHIARLQAHYGRWDLTWAAYNAGQGRVDKALRQYPQADNAAQLDLPNETIQYVNSLASLQSQLAHMDVAHV